MKSIKYRIIFILLVMVFSGLSVGFATSGKGKKAAEASPASIKWYKYEAAMALGKKEEKKIFLHFYSTRCYWCTVMAKKSFTDPAVITYLNTYYIPVRINTDIERKIAMEYRVVPVPTTYFVAGDGDKIGGIPGYIAPGELIVLLKYVNTDSYKIMDVDTFQKNLKKK